MQFTSCERVDDVFSIQCIFSLLCSVAVSLVTAPLTKFPTDLVRAHFSSPFLTLLVVLVRRNDSILSEKCWLIDSCITM